MSDTVFFGKTFTASLKACVLYVTADICLSLAQSMGSMDKAQWDAMWWMQRSAFWLTQIGSAALIVKAFYSNSAK